MLCGKTHLTAMHNQKHSCFVVKPAHHIVLCYNCKISLLNTWRHGIGWQLCSLITCWRNTQKVAVVGLQLHCCLLFIGSRLQTRSDICPYYMTHTQSTIMFCIFSFRLEETLISLFFFFFFVWSLKVEAKQEPRSLCLSKNKRCWLLIVKLGSFWLVASRTISTTF